MRIIKFRGFDKIADGWCIGVPLKDQDIKGRYWLMFNENDGAIIDNSKTIGQFTGFSDCKENEIYEGDILKTRDNSFGYVVWNDGAFAIKSHGSEAIDWEHGSFYRESEVVGNIHENFEILEG